MFATSAPRISHQRYVNILLLALHIQAQCCPKHTTWMIEQQPEWYAVMLICFPKGTHSMCPQRL